MSRNTSIILGEHFDKFIQDEIKSGRYNTASEMIRSGLRLLEYQKSKISAINEALVVGEKSGAPVAFDNEQFKKRLRNKFQNKG
ncbi:TPA: type II toxin-antitoxin system ParD family antitoxin [Candidatus Peregrinibacteria bacterium]|nr:type II toxin-antitoxin system ParD family antitoxin [Candidatus Peregrinibacteria bacterium]